MSDDKKPDIRFKDYSDDWEQRKVSGIGNIVTGSTPKTSVSDNYGGEFLFVSPADIQENRYVDETITTLTKKGFDQGRKIREKASLFVSIGSTIGKVAQINQESTTNQQINAVESYDNFDDDFIFTSLENISGSIKAIASNQAVPIVNKTTFGETEIQVPLELGEQQKIGQYFVNLDHLITLHQRKYDKLQNLKKAMLEKMFPKNGCNVPEIRFKGFTDAWEQRKMGDTSEKVCVGFVGTCEKYYTDETGIPMYRTGNLNGLSLNKDDMKYVTRDFHQQNKKSQLKFGDILIARHGDSGKAVNYESSEEANCLNIVIIRPDFKKCNYRFLTDCINSPRCQKHIKSLSAGSTQAVINTSEIAKLEVLLPESIDEQEKIAAYFENLDHLITLHQRELEKLKNIKKAMLEKMFV